MDKTPYQNKMLKTTVRNKVEQLNLEQRIKALKELDPNSEHLAILELRNEYAKKFLNHNPCKDGEHSFIKTKDFKAYSLICSKCSLLKK